MKKKRSIIILGFVLLFFILIALKTHKSPTEIKIEKTNGSASTNNSTNDGTIVVPIINAIIKPKIISISPSTIFPGDPIMVTINASSSPLELLFDNQSIPILNFDEKNRGLIGVDFNEKELSHKIQVKLSNGVTETYPIHLTLREKIEEPLGIPQKLGGNTLEAQKNLITNLASENYILNNLTTASSTFWTKDFIAPLASLIITDSYGFNRKTGEYTIPHKGTDFHADVGTEVRVMNRGVVKIARTFIVYGNTIVIDHGLGVSTIYMHLSKINVKEGEIVERGQIIGLSGMTGYAEVPHLHLSIKINGISIDPMKFLGFFGIK